MKYKLLIVVLCISVILNLWQLVSGTESVAESDIELTYEQMLGDVAFLLQEDMSENDFVQMERVLEDLTILASNTSNLDYSQHILNQINDIRILLTSENHFHVLRLTNEDRRNLSNIIIDSIEKKEIHVLSFNIEQLLN